MDWAMRRYSGYTLQTVLAEDAYELQRLRTLLDPDFGKAR